LTWKDERCVRELVGERENLTTERPNKEECRFYGWKSEDRVFEDERG